MKKLISLFLCIAMMCGMCVVANAAEYFENHYIILKFDDLGYYNYQNFQKAVDLVEEKGGVCGLGVIGNIMLDAGGNEVPELYESMKKWTEDGHEIWHHGYNHVIEEYSSNAYEQQKEDFGKTMELVKEKTGIEIKTFGSPFNNASKTTIEMINKEFPEINTLLLVSDYDKVSEDLVLPVRCDFEPQTGVVSYDTFVSNYTQLKNTSEYLVLQGHAGMWDENSLNEMAKILDFLNEQGDTIYVTPQQYFERVQYLKENPEEEDKDRIYVRLDHDYIKFDVEPQIINDRTMVPFRAIFEKLGATVEWDSDNRIAGGKLGDIEIKLPIDSNTALVNGEEVTLDVPATIIDDRTLVPIRFVSENFGAIVHWEAEERTVVIRTVKEGCKYELTEGQLAIAGSTWNKAYNDEIGPMSYDGDIESVWSAEGFDVWVCYDLGEVKNVSEVKIMWNKGDARQAKYEVLVSNDGENFTSVFDGLASGTANNEFESTAVNAEARYVKVLCKGNMVGDKAGSWNAIKEIAFFGE